jgi:hypothetical protein
MGSDEGSLMRLGAPFEESLKVSKINDVAIHAEHVH